MRRSEDHAGETFGAIKILRRAKPNPGDRITLWHWKCQTCRSTGTARYSRIKKDVQLCVRCCGRREYSVGATHGVLTITHVEGQGPRQRKYTMECSRCGKTSERTSTKDLRHVPSACMHCVNKFLVFGKLLLTYAEIAEAFGITKATILHRTCVKKMSLDDAIALPTANCAPKRYRKA